MDRDTKVVIVIGLCLIANHIKQLDSNWLPSPATSYRHIWRSTQARPINTFGGMKGLLFGPGHLSLQVLCLLQMHVELLLYLLQIALLILYVSQTAARIRRIALGVHLQMIRAGAYARLRTVIWQTAIAFGVVEANGLVFHARWHWASWLAAQRWVIAIKKKINYQLHYQLLLY